MHKANGTYMLGIDLGGTQVRAALVRRNGKTASPMLSVPTDAFRLEQEDLYARICSLVTDTKEWGAFQGIGIGSTGPVDPVNGRILDCNNLPSMQYFPLAARLSDDFYVPVRLDGDARALLLAEALYGAGKGSKRVLGFTLGTGLGCAFIEQGRILQGSTACAGEIWTSPYKHSIIEDYVSGPALSRHYAELTGEELGGKDIARLAASGSAAARKVFRDFAKDLAYAMAWCTNLLDPDVIVLGGSVAQSAALFLDDTKKHLQHFLCAATRQHIRVCTGMLGAEAGVIGAAALAWRKGA